MVVLSAAVCTKSGRALLARQFVEMSRTRVEGLLAAFPKLVGTGQQHTFVETDSVRYVYQPLEDLFVVLITTKTSNILEDLQTLHLFSRLIPEYCRVTDEDEITAHAYELIFAFDELVTLGYNENLTISQVRTFTEMESHEEKVQEMIARNKEIEAKEQAKLKIKQMEMARKEAQRRARMGGGPVSSLASGFGGNTSGGFSSADYRAGNYSAPLAESPREEYSKPAAGRGPAAPAPGKGLQLGAKKPRADDFLAAMKTEDDLDIALAKTSLGPAAAAPAAPAQPATEAVHLIFEEKVTMVANRDGGVENLEIKGDLMLRIGDADRGHIRVQLANVNDKLFQFKTHPNVDRNLFINDGVIGLKDASRPFPMGQPLGVVKWRFQSKDENDVPLYVNCWPQAAADGCEVAISFQLTREDLILRDVVIALPLPSGAGNPIINDPSVGECEYNKQRKQIEWHIPVVDGEDANKSGEIELKVKNADPDAFFPVRVTFTSNTLYSGLHASDVVLVQGGQAVPFSQQMALIPEEYSVA